MRKPVAVLGSGPSGLLAAHAIAIAGHPVVVVSNTDQPSRLGGAQFLHTPIPELTDDVSPVELTYRLEGTAHIYQEKAYGAGPQPGFVSFGNVKDGQVVPAWNLIERYELLWENWGGSLTEGTVSPEWLDQSMDDFSLVISSVPLFALCRKPMAQEGQAPHRFEEQTIWINNGACGGGHDRNVVWYDGTRDRLWYRSSTIFGVMSTEYGEAGHRRLTRVMDLADQRNFVKAKKPVSHSCDCAKTYDDRLVTVGRFGTWTKGKLVNDAFADTIRALHARDMLPQVR